jgi:DNA-directed RNA polymerase specialized sigma24 family protein
MLAQDLQEELVQKPALLHRFRSERGTLGAYLAGVARKKAQHYLYVLRRRTTQSQLTDNLPDRRVFNDGDLARILEFSATLSPRERDRLMQNIGMTTGKAGTDNNKSPGSDRQTDHRISKKLLRFLRAE